MKTVVRRSVFETNSSSVHTLSIIKNPKNLQIPKKVTIDTGRYFGWENEIYSDLETKLSYLWLAINEYSKEDMRPKFINLLYEQLHKLGINDIEAVDKSDSMFSGIDHGDEAGEFIEEILEDPVKFKNFLFDDESFILTGNDNEEAGYDFSDRESSYVYIKYN